MSLPSSRPNIVLIMCDQMRQDMLGCYGNPIVHTPNIDSLAAHGLRFDRHYVANPICMPSRYSILSGRNPRGHGQWTNGLDIGDAMPPLLSHRLRDGGYRTGAIGKMHLRPFGHGLPADAPAQPEANHAWSSGAYSADWTGPYAGFDHVELSLNHSASASANAHYAAWFAANGGTDAMREIIWDADDPATGVLQTPSALHDSTFVGERSADFIREQAHHDTPFFCWASFPDPHSPFLEPEDMAHAYDTADIPMPIGGPEDLKTRPSHYRLKYEGRFDRRGIKEGPGRRQPSSPAAIKRRRAVNYTEMELIDRGVGTIIEALRETDQWDDTIIIFMADHGELFGDHGLWEKGCFFYEGLVNTPLIIAGPGIVTGSTHSLFSDVDLTPTLCARCGIEPDTFTQGIDQNALFSDPTRRLRDRCLIEYRTGYGAADFASAVLVTRDAKYARYQNGEEEFTDLVADPDERRNVAADPAYREHVDAARQALLDELLATQPRHPAQHCHA